jgi:ABC-type antimicrobial peptide transport system permease subunit
MSYVVTQRTQEFGLRIAMGASAGDVIRMVLRQAAGLLALGILLGLPGALMVTRVLTAFLYGVSPTDLSTYAVVTLTLSLVTLFATLVPARRATKVDPMVALRCE